MLGIQSPIAEPTLQPCCRTPRPSPLPKRYTLPGHSRPECRSHRTPPAQALRSALHLLAHPGSAALNGTGHPKPGGRSQQARRNRHPRTEQSTSLLRRRPLPAIAGLSRHHPCSAGPRIGLGHPERRSYRLQGRRSRGAERIHRETRSGCAGLRRATGESRRGAGDLGRIVQPFVVVGGRGGSTVGRRAECSG